MCPDDGRKQVADSAEKIKKRKNVTKVTILWRKHFCSPTAFHSFDAKNHEEVHLSFAAAFYNVFLRHF
jgi:hypothetical protein